MLRRGLGHTVLYCVEMTDDVCHRRPQLVCYIGGQLLAAAIGVWLFYVQHQFEEAYWQRSAEWNYTDAALRGTGRQVVLDAVALVDGDAAVIPPNRQAATATTAICRTRAMDC